MNSSHSVDLAEANKLLSLTAPGRNDVLHRFFTHGLIKFVAKCVDGEQEGRQHSIMGSPMLLKRCTDTHFCSLTNCDLPIE